MTYLSLNSLYFLFFSFLCKNGPGWNKVGNYSRWRYELFVPVSWYPWFVPRCRVQWGKEADAVWLCIKQSLCSASVWPVWPVVWGWPALACFLCHHMVYRGIAAWMVSPQNHSWLETSLCAFEHVYPQPRVSCTQLNHGYRRKRCFFCSALCHCDKTPEVNSL